MAPVTRILPARTGFRGGACERRHGRTMALKGVQWENLKDFGPSGEEERMLIELRACTVRSWRPADAESLARYANNRKIWRNLRDAFPHPYSLSDAKAFIALALGARPETMFAICLNDEAIGGIGFMLHSDVERISAEIGYWIGEPFWGRGIAAEALKAVTSYAIGEHGLKRVYAVPFAGNEASHRVLEKAGYAFEGRTRKSALKDGEVIDQLLYAYVVD